MEPAREDNAPPTRPDAERHATERTRSRSRSRSRSDNGRRDRSSSEKRSAHKNRRRYDSRPPRKMRNHVFRDDTPPRSSHSHRIALQPKMIRGSASTRKGSSRSTTGDKDTRASQRVPGNTNTSEGNVDIRLVMDPDGARSTNESTDVHSLGFYGHFSSSRGTIDMTVQQPSIIVGAPNASVAIGAGDYTAPVLVVYGSEATVVDTATESVKETCNNLMNYANMLDFSCPDTRFQTEPSSRRHISHYRHRLLNIVSQYNEIVPVGSHARYHKGSIHFSATILGTSFRLTEGSVYSWANLLAPTVSSIRYSYLLITSLRGTSAVCQPAITHGGLHTCLISYGADHVPPQDKLIKIDVSALFFVPYKIPEFGIRLMTIEENLLRTSSIRLGIMTPVKRLGCTHVALFSGLVWTTRTMIADNGQPSTTYAAWFECTQENSYSLCTFWRPGQRAVYECGEYELGINIESLYTTGGGKKLVGTLVVDNEYPPTALPPVDLMPSMIVLRFELHGLREREPPILFSTNPTSCLKWPSEETASHIIIYASYDITFVGGEHPFYLDIRYSKMYDRHFIVSGCPSEIRFHTAMTIWRPETPLKFTLISPVSNMQIHRGTPIATLYLVSATEGNIIKNDEKTSLRLVRNGNRSHLYLSELRLPVHNFVIFDEL
uniref:Protein UL31 n=1 Tax=Mastomys natalensis cytomegalovirus 1 TaxID=2973541 RepID=A0A9Y1N9Q3_9BETA|nr:protein UL31 [Mastomys natalensis cytomegalovirus 1]WEG68895.1 protein UL31 [Mastomys natalensis cytomegalovirus 1]WEG71123.1 protein UL31 [Mastomys natalensis cytomegalovirus 1]